MNGLCSYMSYLQMWCRSHGIYHQQTNDLPTNVLKFCPEVTQNIMFSCQKEELEPEHSTEPQTQEIQTMIITRTSCPGQQLTKEHFWIQQDIRSCHPLLDLLADEMKSKEVHFFLQSKDEPNKTWASLTRCCSNKPEFIGVNENCQQ